MGVKFAIQTVPSREDLLGELQGQLPAEDTVTYVDRDGDYMEAYIGLLRQMRGEPFVRLEDDVELCQFFVPRITAAIGVFPHDPINFFYLRGKNKTKRPERHPGSDYCMGQCIYIPGWLSTGMVRAYERGIIPNPKRHGGKTGVGFVTSDYIVLHRRNYVLWYPCLVQHREVPTVIPGAHAARHAHRQTKHFADDVGR